MDKDSKRQRLMKNNLLVWRRCRSHSYFTDHVIRVISANKQQSKNPSANYFEYHDKTT